MQMKNLINILLLLGISVNLVTAIPLDETLVNLAQAQGITIYHSCIDPPPADPNTVAYCNSIYIIYLSELTVINTPFPIVPSLDPSPYSWSPYDICRYEVANMIFNEITQSPYYCPVL